MYKDIAQYVQGCPYCEVAKGPYVGPKTQPGSIIANGPTGPSLCGFYHHGSINGKEMSWS